MNEFIHVNFDIGNFENGVGYDFANFGEWKISELVFKCGGVCWGDFNEQTSVDFDKESD